VKVVYTVSVVLLYQEGTRGTSDTGLDTPITLKKAATDRKYMCLLPQPTPAYTLCPPQPTYRFAILF
jgi:hypothetical protein